MAAQEELFQMKLITELSNQAVHEYEGLQREHERATMECQRMQAERDEAVKRLEEFQKVSHMVIEEVNSIQDNLDIERTCRQSVEALASKLNRQNCSLKRKSMLYLAHLGPETIAEIGLEDEEEEEESGETQVEKECLSAHCQSTITELKKKIELTLEEKKQATIDHEATRDELRDIREELLKEKHDNMVLIAETVRQKKILAKYNRVSLFAVEEYEALQENLDLEKELRAEAEKFAREMLVEQKKLNRQSQILLKSSSPSEALQAALTDVTRLTQALESQRLEHQQQMKGIEEQLRGSELHKEVLALQRKLELLAEEKREHEERCSKAKVEAKDLKFTEMDIRQQAVDEMMQRIKRGVHLRPVGQAPNKTKPVQRERVPSNSAIQELKGILDTFKRPSPHLKVGSPSTNTESELERVLQRRRGAFKTSQESCLASSPRPFPSSVLDVTRVRGDHPQTKQNSQDSVPL
ncbi:shootin-1 isoform X3 [Salvelinus namaycush]|uniref:Shootin-1 n=1 Tax=Salvelinus namaycush TaxID=8040 RepID=A0A8U0THQ2_SALNM|nr:shootin-1 isoform X3 [Salvelinus namaycush]